MKSLHEQAAEICHIANQWDRCYPGNLHVETLVDEMAALIAVMDARIVELEAATEILGLTPEDAKAGLKRSKANALDAERYRWLKANSGFGVRKNQVTELSVMLYSLPNGMHQLDAAIDAARKTSVETQSGEKGE